MTLNPDVDWHHAVSTFRVIQGLDPWLLMDLTWQRLISFFHAKTVWLLVSVLVMEGVLHDARSHISKARRLSVLLPDVAGDVKQLGVVSRAD